MFGISDYGAFVAAIVLFLAVPGPGNLALLSSTAQGGVRGGLAATLGLIAGDQVLLWCAVAGVAALLQSAPTLFAAVQWLGAAYLAWLGWRMLSARPGQGAVLRLAPRHDPLPALFEAYADAREGLRQREGLAWTLRRFERDLLEALGVGFALDEDAEGDPIDPAARYRLDPEQGPRRLLSDRGHEERSRAATGRALLALARDVRPSADDLASLRLPLRSVLAHHLGPRGLKSWEMLGELGRLGVPRPPAAA